MDRRLFERCTHLQLNVREMHAHVQNEFMCRKFTRKFIRIMFNDVNSQITVDQ